MKKSAEEIYRDRQQFFNDRAGEWLELCYRDPQSGRFDLHAAAFDRLFTLVPLRPGERVLDAGCGSGVLVPMILERIGPEGLLWELDFAERMIEENRRTHREPNIRFLVADVARAPLEPESFDTVFCFSCFPHFDRKPEVVGALARALRPGGSLVISHFNSAEEINRHHESFPAVSHDHLPGPEAMKGMVVAAGLRVDEFIDEDGFYCLLARK